MSQPFWLIVFDWLTYALAVVLGAAIGVFVLSFAIYWLTTR